MIPVSEPVVLQEDIDAVTAALHRGEISGNFGQALRSFEEEFAAWCGVRFGVAVTSGTTALELAVAAAGVGAGDEVLISSSTNIATALAVTRNQALPVPVDSEDVTWNLDLDLVEGLITPRTKAIIPVHLFGHPVDMDRLGEIARRHDLVVIEDCAEAHGATVRGRRVGGFGHMGCFSFYANKVITTGEGGMVVTDDEQLADRLRLLRNLAFTTPRFRHEVAGYNFRMTGYQAAMGLSQFRRIDSIIEQKRRLAAAYNAALWGIPGIQLPAELEWATNVYWMYSITVNPPFPKTRDELMAHLLADGIDTRTFFCPMNQQPFLLEIDAFSETPCPVADRIWTTGLYLPSTFTLDDAAVGQIADSIRRAAA